MYFILKLLPIAMVWVTVDIKENTRDYGIIKAMEHYKHLQINEADGMIQDIAATKQGVNFFNYLVRIGFGTIQTEDEGKEIINQLEQEYKLKRSN